MKAYKSAAIRAGKMVQLGTNMRQQAETKAYFSGLTTPVSSSQQKRIDDTVKNLKTRLSISELSEMFDVLYFAAGETEESSKRNIVKNAHHLTSTAMPTFTAFKGFKGNKSSQYLDTNYNASISGLYTQNDASMGGYVAQADSNTSVFGTYWGVEDGTRYVRFLPSKSDFIFWQINSSISVNIASSKSSPDRAFYVQNRLASPESKMYKNGQLYDTYTAASNGIPNGNIYLLARNNIGVGPSLFSDARISCWFAGKGLTAGQIAIINDEIEKYMVSVNNAFQVNITTPTVIFSFDDGNAEHISLTKSIFDARNKKCTHFITSDLIGTAGFMTIPNLQTLNAAGYDLQCHSKTHTNPSTLSEAQLIAEFQAVDAFFTTNELPIPKHHAYPGGVYNATILNVVYKFRQTARTIGNSNVNYNGYIMDLCKIQCARAIDTLTVATNMISAIDAAKANNSLVVFYGHGVYETITAESAYPNPVKASAIADAIDYAIANGVAVKTINEVFETDY